MINTVAFTGVGTPVAKEPEWIQRSSYMRQQMVWLVSLTHRFSGVGAASHEKIGTASAVLFSRHCNPWRSTSSFTSSEKLRFR